MKIVLRTMQDPKGHSLRPEELKIKPRNLSGELEVGLLILTHNVSKPQLDYLVGLRKHSNSPVEFRIELQLLV